MIVFSSRHRPASLFVRSTSYELLPLLGGPRIASFTRYEIGRKLTTDSQHILLVIPNTPCYFPLHFHASFPPFLWSFVLSSFRPLAQSD
jgi:hypothetical protein